MSIDKSFSLKTEYFLAKKKKKFNETNNSCGIEERVVTE